MLHLSESDTKSFTRTKYVLELVKDFLDIPLEKNNDHGVVRSSPHEDLISEFFNTPVPLSASVEDIFLLSIKTFSAKGDKRCAFSNA